MKKVKFLTMFLITFLVLQVALPLCVMAEDTNFNDAKQITLGQKINDNIESGIQNYYSFSTTKNDSWYRLSYVMTTGNLCMKLYDEDGSKILECTGYSNELMVKNLKLESEKVYYVEMDTNANNNGDYCFTVDELLDKNSDTQENATNIISGVKRTEKLDCYGDNDYFCFAAGATKSTVTVTSNFPHTVGVKVYNEDGAEIDYDSMSQNKTCTITINTVKGEKYFVNVKTDYNLDDKTSGTYYITVKSGVTDISKMDIDNIVNQKSDVYIFNGNLRLIKDVDYTLFVKITKPGIASVTIKGKGTYNGTVTKECIVVSKKL